MIRFERAGLSASVVVLTLSGVVAGGATAAVSADNAGNNPPGPVYSMIDLGLVGTGSVSYGNGLNDEGDVAGTGRTTSASRPQAAVRWRAGESTGAILELLPSSTFARAFDLNDDGTAVGEAFNSAGSSVAVRWDDAGQIETVGSLNVNGTGVANDVNDAGTVVGSSYDGTIGRAFRSTPNGIAALPTPTAEEGSSVGATVANAVAADDTTVGWASVTHPADATHDNAFTVQTPAAWFADGSYELLTSPGGISVGAVAVGVASDHTVVGYSTENGTDAAARWRNGTIQPLVPVEDPSTPGQPWRHSRALATDAHGVVVGYSSKFAGNYSFGGSATRWVDGQAEDLNDLVDLPAGWTLWAASDINEAGQITGTATVDGTTRAYLLTPDPTSDEPAAVVPATDVVPAAPAVPGAPATGAAPVGARVGSTIVARLRMGRRNHGARLVVRVLAVGVRPVGTVKVRMDGKLVRSRTVHGRARFVLPRRAVSKIAAIYAGSETVAPSRTKLKMRHGAHRVLR